MPPPVKNVVPYELGALEGTRLTFSDAKNVGGTSLFSASAEGKGDTIAGSDLEGDWFGA